MKELIKLWVKEIIKKIKDKFENMKERIRACCGKEDEEEEKSPKKGGMSKEDKKEYLMLLKRLGICICILIVFLSVAFALPPP